MVANGETLDTRADFDHHACAFVTQDGRKQAFGVRPRQRVLVGVADAGGFDLHHDLAFPGSVQLHGVHFKGFARSPRDGSSHIHRSSLTSCPTNSVIVA